MELLIPMVLAGSIYVIKKQKDNKNVSNNNQKNIEGYGNIYNKSYNIPRSCDNDLVTSNDDKIEDYGLYINPDQNGNVSKHFIRQNLKEKIINEERIKERDIQQPFISMSGNPMTKENMVHNNQVPFGRKSTTNYYKDNREGLLDVNTGNGSQHIKKSEIAPLFKPQTSMGWTSGMPNSTDFIKNRMNPSMKMNNIKPFEEIKVGPSIMRGDTNDTNNNLGMGGFNSGMMNRESFMPRTTDEIRVRTNPKQTYEGTILGGQSSVQNRGILGNMEKNTPDTYFINTPDRYLTTVGAEKAPVTRSGNILKPEHRIHTTKEYYGAPKYYKEENYNKNINYEEPKRPQLQSDIAHVSNIYMPNSNQKNSTEKNSYKNSQMMNNRTLMSNNKKTGFIGTTIKAMVNPVMDTLRFTRKDNVIGNARVYGNLGSTVPINSIFNPSDKTRTTIREMTEHDKGHRFMGNQQEGAYSVSKQQNVYQHRANTSYSSMGNVGNTHATSNPMNYDSMYNAELIDKNTISQGRNPTQSSVKVSNGKEHINMNIRKNDLMDRSNSFNANLVHSNTTPSKDMLGNMNVRNDPYEKQISRNTPELLNAFKENPYTKSLQSY